MNDLKNTDLKIIENFISITEENLIVSQIPGSIKIKTSDRNSIRRYGSNTPYKNQIESNIIPDYLGAISEKIIKNKLLEIKPISISINEYLAGNCISAHIDSLASGPIITILSLLSEATMVFSKSQDRFSIIVPGRSLIQIKSDLRYKWKHEILPVKNKRYSIVFR